MNSKPLVSVLITTKNSAEFLEESIVSILSNKRYYDNIELIIVDNYSTDHTLEIANRYTDKVYSYGPERTAQANWGILHAKGELIYLTGSDMTRDHDFIKQGVEKILEGYDAIYMSVKTDRRVKHYWGKVKKIEREAYIGSFIESARFFKKKVWNDIGGFDNCLVQLEEDFQHKLDARGYRTGRINAREYHLHEEENLWKMAKKFYYYGGYCRHYLKTHKGRGLIQLNPARPCFFEKWKLFARHPKLIIGFIAYKMVQYIAGGLGLLFGRVK